MEAQTANYFLFSFGVNLSQRSFIVELAKPEAS
jgi:hypothetical protein